jgi:hypothetical protein
MQRWLSTLLVFACCSAIVRADVTFVQTTAIEGGMAAMASGSGNRTTTTRVKGLKLRTEADGGGVAIADVAAKQVVILRADEKTATIMSPSASTTSTTSTTSPTPASVEAAVAPTGKSQVIDGAKCDEYKLTSSMALSDVLGGRMPPEAAGMMQGVTVAVTGSIWAAKDAPGAADFLAFQKAAVSADMLTLIAGASGASLPGLDKVMRAMANAEGLPYLVDILISVEGTGQVADLLKQMGGMKITIKTTSVKADPIGDDLFKIPEGYTVK